MNDSARIRGALAQIKRHCRVEMANIPLAAAGPTIGRMIEGLTYSSTERRSDVIERAVEDLVELLGQTRRTISACNARVADEGRKAARVAKLHAVGGGGPA